MKEMNLIILRIFILTLSWLSAQAADIKPISPVKLQLPAEAFWIDNHWRNIHDHSQFEPVNWRTVTNYIKFLNDEESSFNEHGLKNLFISGSANPTLANMLWLKKTYGTKHPVYVIDLRQETHIYVNGLPISIFYKENEINRGKTTAEINATEQAWANHLPGMGKILINKLGKPKNGYKVPTDPITVTVKTAYTEQNAAKKAGVGYFRIEVPDYHPPAPSQVDQFLTIVKKIPQNSWLHFHCAAGKGRTTTFMVMRDILANGRTVGLEDILNRQALLGGIDLFATSKSIISQPWKNEYHKARIDYIKLFYTYIHSGASLDQSFSAWLIKQPDGPYKLVLKTDAYKY